jgi:peptidoglycan hydrolase-like protein with peptidoglycan-binding domain/3D (Asp-Asp-Asp) domain-containing protein
MENSAIISGFMNTKIIAGFVVSALFLQPLGVTAQGSTDAFEQEFVITAYYSPLPNQCCYVLGSYEADMELNGEGVTGADGTKVYPGMVAAPKSYAFGTRIDLPGIGIVTVHDRGGAIQELSTGAHRLDIWAGFGEEGLARALAFGVQEVKAKVYPSGVTQPAESFALANLPSPATRLLAYAVSDEHVLLSLSPKLGETSGSALLLQRALRDTGYLAVEPSGTFGPQTKEALAAFQKDMHLEDSSEILSLRSAAFLAALHLRKNSEGPIGEIVDASSKGSTIAAAKRTLRFLGYYRGQTEIDFNDALKSAITNFQKSHGIINSDTEAGAGRIGPKTLKAVTLAWRQKLVAAKAEKLLTMQKLKQELAAQRKILTRTLTVGDEGADVVTLQKLLAGRSHLSEKRITGYFGEETKRAVAEYQVAMGILDTKNHPSAGQVGPRTISLLNKEEVRKIFLRMQSGDTI